ncbi:N,N'-diacetylbacillosaminyl-diphospho-undecaprenol alpha-1,3-N-acetylgalactosaminyltransferase [Planctopirus ephydatiae]|uniref:N, N'-diacetylbacillosaminyl-diphospho-undecaprenol alpha-1,3-N-acetylgalactosaminyltransferase n=1 Tax=Planctopirus ephydatiae TaxID=2528019 RepID=A0A518GLH8_9PLAN|nr:glycosyltransferase family 4 protein [Planctopirus ephydatiae]QDV29512.1 N,N'-diacetylbacillosaminyl-diphospho-undecaprenol alpha-1,3-N-acetylgalactosaminyltransferase [Planctopirus ephydatiae]
MKHGRDLHCDIAIIVTTPQSVKTCFRGCIRSFANRGWSVSVVAPEDEAARELVEHEGGSFHALDFDREISPWRDLISLFKLRSVLRELAPEMVLCATPKAGFLGSVAAFMCRVPARVYAQFGLRMETCRGPKRWLTWACERLAISASTVCWCVGESLKNAVIRYGLATANQLVVLGDGTSSGVEFERFAFPDTEKVKQVTPEPQSERSLPWIGFVGRLTKDKGVEDLYAAFCRINEREQKCRLLLVGGFEDGDPVSPFVRQAIENDSRVVVTDFVTDTSLYYPHFQILVLPSFREGFPNVPLEAACAGIPTVGYAATGTVDAILDGETGTVVPLGNVPALAQAIGAYIDDPFLREKHGQAARARAKRDYDPERIWTELYRLFCRLLIEKGISLKPGPTQSDSGQIAA